MSSLFFWIIILSFVVPMAMRAYRRSMARRDRDQGLPGPFSGPGQFPGSNQFPGSAGPQSNQPRDGYTQQDYFSGGFRQPGQPQSPYGGQQLPPYQYGPPMGDPRHGTPSQEFGQEPPFQQQPQQPPYGQQPAYPGHGQSSGPATPPPPAAPQGYRARKLAELDQQYSNGELSMEEYMKRRGDIMNG